MKPGAIQSVDCTTYNAPGVSKEVKHPEKEYEHRNFRVGSLVIDDVVSKAWQHLGSETRIGLPVQKFYGSAHLMDSCAAALEHNGLMDMEPFPRAVQLDDAGGPPPPPGGGPDDPPPPPPPPGGGLDDPPPGGAGGGLDDPPSVGYVKAANEDPFGESGTANALNSMDSIQGVVGEPAPEALEVEPPAQAEEPAEPETPPVVDDSEAEAPKTEEPAPEALEVEPPAQAEEPAEPEPTETGVAPEPNFDGPSAEPTEAGVAPEPNFDGPSAEPTEAGVAPEPTRQPNSDGMYL